MCIYIYIERERDVEREREREPMKRERRTDETREAKRARKILSDTSLLGLLCLLITDEIGTPDPN